MATSNGPWTTTKSKDTKCRSPQTREKPPLQRVPEIPKGILRTKSPTVSKETLLGPHHRPETWCPKLSTRESVLPNTTWTSSPKRISEETTRKGLYPTIQKPICCPLLLHQKEKWRIMTCPGLLQSKWMDSEESLPPPTHTRTNQPSKRGKPLLKVQRTIGIQ